MSFDLIVFDQAAAPEDRAACIAWIHEHLNWDAERNFNDPGGLTGPLPKFFDDVREILPPLNGPHAVSTSSTEDPPIEAGDYTLAGSLIYAAFTWPIADAAYLILRAKARIHGVGFYNISGPRDDPENIVVAEQAGPATPNEHAEIKQARSYIAEARNEHLHDVALAKRWRPSPETHKTYFFRDIDLARTIGNPAKARLRIDYTERRSANAPKAEVWQFLIIPDWAAAYHLINGDENSTYEPALEREQVFIDVDPGDSLEEVFSQGLAQTEQWAAKFSHDALLGKYTGDIPTKPGIFQTFHLVALALSGNVDRLEDYKVRFEAGDETGFYPMTTIDCIQRALKLAHAYTPQS